MSCGTHLEKGRYTVDVLHMWVESEGSLVTFNLMHQLLNGSVFSRDLDMAVISEKNARNEVRAYAIDALSLQTASFEIREAQLQDSWDCTLWQAS